MLHISTSLAPLALLGFLTAAAPAQNCRTDRLSSSISTEDNRFGADLDVSGKWMIVGAPGEQLFDDQGLQVGTPGTAHVYERVGGVWLQDGILFSDPPFIAVSQAGLNVAIEGSLAATTGEGAPYVLSYERVNGRWESREPLLLAPETQSVAIRDLELEGDRLYVSWNGTGVGSLSLFVDEYQAAGQDWVLVQRFQVQAGLNFSTDATFTNPGELEVDGDRMVIGFPEDGGSGTPGAGAVHVLDRTSGFWVQEAVLYPALPLENGAFGQSIDLDGSRIAVGHRTVGFASGRATVFEEFNGAWVQLVEVAGPGTQGPGFLMDVALRGDVLAVADPVGLGSFPSSTRGLVGLHELDNGVWSPAGQLRAISAGPDENFGTAVAFAPGGELLVGHPAKLSGPEARGIVDAVALDGSGCSDFLVSPKVETADGGVFTEMALLGGSDLANMGYAVLISGTAGGGTTVDGVEIPLIGDGLTLAALSGAPGFSSLVGLLGPAGRSESPSLRFDSLPASAAGLDLHLAWVAYELVAPPFGIQYASELRGIQILP